MDTDRDAHKISCDHNSRHTWIYHHQHILQYDKSDGKCVHSCQSPFHKRSRNWEARYENRAKYWIYSFLHSNKNKIIPHAQTREVNITQGGQEALSSWQGWTDVTAWPHGLFLTQWYWQIGDRVPQGIGGYMIVLPQLQWSSSKFTPSTQGWQSSGCAQLYMQVCIPQARVLPQTRLLEFGEIEIRWLQTWNSLEQQTSRQWC